MTKSTTTARNQPKRPRRRAPEPRYDRGQDLTEPRRPPVAADSAEPRLGPYEFRYSVELGYPSPVLG